MYLGAYQLGGRVALTILCHDANGVPLAPDAAPRVSVHGGQSNVFIAAFDAPPLDRPNAPGLFQMVLHLGGRFPVGYYEAFYTYSVGLGSNNPVEHDSFQVVAGGDPRGAVLALYALNKPHAQFLIQQCDSGKILKGSNPSV